MNSEEYRKQLFHPKTDKYNLLSYLKQEHNYEGIKKILRHINTHPFVKSVLTNNSRPSQYNDIRKQKLIPYSGSLEGEAAFYLVMFEQNHGLITDFLALKEAFDSSLILADYLIAEELLKRIEKISGKSIWLIENQLILKELKEGVKANWNEVSELSKQISEPLVLFYLENLSKRAESKISYFRYLNIFNNQLSENLNKDFCEYLYFRLNYLGLNRYQNFDFFLYLESGFALVDRYLMLRSILGEICNIQSTEEHITALIISKKLNDLFPQDKLVCQILTLLSPIPNVKIEADQQVYNYIDKYSSGDFNFCCENGLTLIKLFPTTFEIYEIFSKSIIELDAEINIEELPELVKNILNILIEIFSNKGNLEQNIDLGLKISTTFSSTSWARQFLSLLKSSTANDNGYKHFNIHYVINSQIKNPRVLYFSNEQNINGYLGFLKNEPLLSNTTDILTNIIIGNYNYFDSANNLPSIKTKVYYGRALLKAHKFAEAIQYFENLYIKKHQSEIFNEEILVNLFRSYIKSNLKKEACCLFVENHLVNKGITKRLNTEKLLETLEEGDNKEMNALIEVPIFYRVAAVDPYQQYVAYDTYLESLGFVRPTELLEMTSVYDNRMIFFLREVCTIEIMHHSYHFTGTDDIENERLKILNTLLVNDSQNSDYYVQEITELNQNANIREAIREVNKGRITVNIQQLKNIEINNIKEAFTRYRDIESYSKENEILGIDTTINMLREITNINIDELIPNKVVFTNDPAFISFKVIFIEIRDKFILSKEYGLDGYLSTRIRHGTLLNHIRSVFESGNIISQRDKHNNYLENEFWNQPIPVYLLDKRPQIQNAIKKFSRSIDEFTEFVIKEQIQVKTEKYSKKPKALFDFSISNNELALLFSIARGNIKDHNSFMIYVFDYLQRFTEKLLLSIRKYINGDLKENYNKILQDFNTEIKEITGHLNYPELTTAIALCGTRLQNELKSISEWFYLSSSSKDEVLDLKVLIQTSIQITNTIYPNFRINPIIKDDIATQTVGTIHLIYLFRILLDNIISHSKLAPNELNIEIELTITEDSFLKISIKNNFSSAVDTTELRSKLEVVKKKWDISSDDYENIDIEGGSGFDKIRRIVAFDLSCQEYKFDFSIQNNCLNICIYIELIDIPKYDDGN